MNKNGIYFLGKESFCIEQIKRIDKFKMIEMLSTAKDREQIEAIAKVHSEEVYNLVMSDSLKG